MIMTLMMMMTTKLARQLDGVHLIDHDDDADYDDYYDDNDYDDNDYDDYDDNK